MKKKESFLDRNKKKSLLAALLLFLRRRKALVVLLFLLLAASAVFVGQSSWIASWPGGRRFMRGVTWVDAKLGFGPSRFTYEDMLAAFHLRRTVRTESFVRGGAPEASVPNSLDFVTGTQTEVEGGDGPVERILDPEDIKGGDDVLVSLGPEDMGGERESSVRKGFAGGFLNGLVGISGGAYAGQGFFSGTGGAAAYSTGDRARQALEKVGNPTAPKGKIAAAAKGKLSAQASRAVQARESRGFSKARGFTGASQAYVQLALGSGRAQLATEYCRAASGCPGEFASTNSGAIYDGNYIAAGFLTSSDPGATQAGLISATVSVPPDTTLSGGADADTLIACENWNMQCAAIQKVGTDSVQMDQTMAQISYYADQIAVDCAQPCTPCGSITACLNDRKALNDPSSGLCNAALQAALLPPATCPPPPPNCGAVGVTGDMQAQMSCSPNSADLAANPTNVVLDQCGQTFRLCHENLNNYCLDPSNAQSVAQCAASLLPGWTPAMLPGWTPPPPPNP